MEMGGREGYVDPVLVVEDCIDQYDGYKRYRSPGEQGGWRRDWGGGG